MNPSDIGKAYDQITHLWQSDKFDRANGIAAHHRALQFASNRHAALDVGCGCTGRFADVLLDAGFHGVVGVDISEKMLSLARQRHPDMQFYCADICQWELPGFYDFITAWDSIWHIPLQEHPQVIAKLVNGLNPAGILIFSFGGTDAPDEHQNNLMGPDVYYSTPGTEGVREILQTLDCSILHIGYDQHPETHTYVIVQRQ